MKEAPEPATKQQLAIEAKKLAGAGERETLMRLHRHTNMMSGAFVILAWKPEQLTAAHCEEWLARLAAMTKDVTRLSKKRKPQKRKQR